MLQKWVHIELTHLIHKNNNINSLNLRPITCTWVYEMKIV